MPAARGGLWLSLSDLPSIFKAGESYMVIRKELGGKSVEIEVKGNLIGDAVGEFREALYAEVDSPCTSISLNLERVQSINSSAIGALLLFRKRAREKGKSIRIEKCSDMLRKTLLALRFDAIMPMPHDPAPGPERAGR